MACCTETGHGLSLQLCHHLPWGRAGGDPELSEAQATLPRHQAVAPVWRLTQPQLLLETPAVQSGAGQAVLCVA